MKKPQVNDEKFFILRKAQFFILHKKIMGSFTILPHHAPVVSSLSAGKVAYVKADGMEENFEIKGGFIEMNNNHVSVCIN